MEGDELLGGPRLVPRQEQSQEPLIDDRLELLNAPAAGEERVVFQDRRVLLEPLDDPAPCLADLGIIE